ncbi:MAG TPA: hypothetical protein QGF02_01250 [Candidatus Babeliales bacterium]|nr:hypothetical protein [Candidatus Babeliales bacterium]
MYEVPLPKHGLWVHPSKLQEASNSSVSNLVSFKIDSLDPCKGSLDICKADGTWLKMDTKDGSYWLNDTQFRLVKSLGASFYALEEVETKVVHRLGVVDPTIVDKLTCPLFRWLHEEHVRFLKGSIEVN